jgi:hypothetical protein
MVEKKRKSRTTKSEQGEQSSFDENAYVEKWQAMRDAGDDEQRVLNLHAIMRDVKRLKKSHDESSVLAALRKVYADSASRTRLQRLIEIPVAELRIAMRDFRNAKGQNEISRRCKNTFTTSHLEALSRCENPAERLELLQKCASGGWTVTKLRDEVHNSSQKPRYRPIELAKQIRQYAEALLKKLDRLEQESLLVALEKVKVEHREEGHPRLEEAISVLEKLKLRISEKEPVLTLAERKMKQLLHQSQSKPSGKRETH